MASRRSDIVRALLDADSAAAKAAESGRAALGAAAPNQQEVLRCVRDYVLAKYRSLAKALAVDPELAMKANAASTCDGASTTDMKQALLLMALQKDFGVRLDGIELAYAETLGDLAALVAKAPSREEA